MKKIIFFSLCLLVLTVNGFGQKSKPKSTKGKPKSTTSKAKPPSAPAVVLSQFESEILAEVNALRANPKLFVEYLEQMKTTFNGKVFKNAKGVEFVSIEGTAAIDDAIVALKSQGPLPAFKVSNGLGQAAKSHLQDMIANDFFGHRGSDQTLPDERAAKFGSAPQGVSENLAEGSSTAREIVLQMIISDGLKSRSQRQNLLSPQFKVVGISAGEAKKGTLCVLMLADTFKDKS